MKAEIQQDSEEFIGRDFYSAQKASETIGISSRKLVHWEKLGIVRPWRYKNGARIFRKYTELDISRATFVHLLVIKCFYSLQDAIRKLQDLA